MIAKIEYRALRTTELLRTIWGPGTDGLHFIGSPHEGELIDDAELILHELAHQTLMPSEETFTPGAMEAGAGWMTKYISHLPHYRQDLHEIKAIAIELLVGRRLKLKLRRQDIILSGRRNTKLLKRRPWRHLSMLVRKAQKLPHVEDRADMLMVFISEQRKIHQW